MRVAVALSGGVDSAVTAALLREAGCEVIGVIMRIWDGRPMAVEPERHACYGPGEEEDVADAQRIADHLGIPLHVLDLAREYNAAVLALCTRQYQAGLTPNPCVHCNRRMKFELIPRRLRDLGVAFDRFATGHYAVVARDASRDRYLLERGRDPQKDQSYFLYQLRQETLAQTLLPLGERTKAEIRRRAIELGLPVAGKSESQDFVAGGYDALFEAPGQPGPILFEDGTILGEHRGIRHYTVGQRRGLGVAWREPLYVLALDPDRNAVIVGTGDRLHRCGLIAGELNWIAIDDLEGPVRCEARIRYRHTPAPATITPLAGGRVQVRFERPQRAIAPGQAVVFYQGDLVLGGGIIERPEA